MKAEMRSVCSWCGNFMRTVPCCARNAGQTTHGICAACYTAQLADLDQLAARQVERDVTAESFAAEGVVFSS